MNDMQWSVLIIYGSGLFKQTSPVYLFFLWIVGERVKSNLNEGKSFWFQRMGNPPGVLPKFVVRILGTVPFCWSAEGFEQNHTSKRNSDQPAEYTTNSILFSFPSSLVLSFLHNLEGEQTCHNISQIPFRFHSRRNSLSSRIHRASRYIYGLF